MKPIQQIESISCPFSTYHPRYRCSLDASIRGDDVCTTMDEMVCQLAIKYHKDRKDD